MAARRKIAAEQFNAGAMRARPSIAGEQHEAMPSPALEMQARLAQQLDGEGRWHPLATLGFVVATCGGFWTVAAWGVSRLIAH